MYLVKPVNKYTDEIVPIILHGNGSYIEVPLVDAKGFCCKIATEYEVETEDGTKETVTAPLDTVFQFEPNSLKGTEPVGSFEEVSGAMLMEQAQQNEQALGILGVQTQEVTTNA